MSRADDDASDDPRIAVPIRATGYLHLHVPDEPATGPAPLVVAVHGYRQPAQRLLTYAAAVAPAGAVVAAPEGPSAFYGPRRSDGRPPRIDHGWIADPRREDAEARNRDLIDRTLEVAAARAEVDPARTWMLGFSQGVGVAVDYAVHRPQRIAGLVGLAGGVPTHGRRVLDALAGRPVLWVTGRRDEAYPPDYEEALVRRMEAAGLLVEHLVLDTGHDLLGAARERVRDWLAGQDADIACTKADGSHAKGRVGGDGRLERPGHEDGRRTP